MKCAPFFWGFIACSCKVTEASSEYFSKYHRALIQSLQTRVSELVGYKSHLGRFQLMAYYLIVGNPVRAERLLWYKLAAESSKQALKSHYQFQSGFIVMHSI